ncbi:hypothetical protein LCAC16_80188 [Leuconostoc carnosum]|nr:hypothetical protein LCAC16_80188 [Leuconostoc carnosum]
MTNLHILPSQFEEEDFYRLNTVLSAQPEKDRVKTGAQFLAEMAGQDGSGNSL